MNTAEQRIHTSFTNAHEKAYAGEQTIPALDPGTITAIITLIFGYFEKCRERSAARHLQRGSAVAQERLHEALIVTNYPGTEEQRNIVVDNMLQDAAKMSRREIHQMLAEAREVPPPPKVPIRFLSAMFIACLLAIPCQAQERFLTNSLAPGPSSLDVSPPLRFLSLNGKLSPAGIASGSLSAAEQPTPWPAVSKGIDLLNIRPSDVLIDFGCGYDARWLTEAAKYCGAKGVGFEINPALAASAQHRVEAQGLADWVTVVEGDSTQADLSRWNPNVGVAYLESEVLEQLKPQILKLDRFASYQFPVPGLQMKKVGDFYLWSRPQELLAVTKRVIERLPQGSYCQICNSYCRDPMRHRLIEIPQAAPEKSEPVVKLPASQQASGHWEWRQYCTGVGRNKRCYRQQVWVQD